MWYVGASARVLVSGYLDVAENMAAVGELICLADTGVSSITAEIQENTENIKLPSDIPNEIKEAILEENRVSFKFSVESSEGEFVQFDQDAMSEGTVRLFQMLPVILISLARGSLLVVDELDAHFHPSLLALILKLFHDDDINKKGSQIIFTAHDTNVLNSGVLRRDQIWFVCKDHGTSNIKSLEEYDKKYVRPDSPFDAFYMDGRLGALPKFSYDSVKTTILKAISAKDDYK
jgi:AAA15 family ATPase/GTPase